MLSNMLYASTVVALYVLCICKGYKCKTDLIQRFLKITTRYRNGCDFNPLTPT